MSDPHDQLGPGPGRWRGLHSEPREGAPEWLISFADNVALMMGFFVILLCMNMAKASLGGGGESGDSGVTAERDQTMLDFALAVREAFHNPVDINSSDPADALLVQRLKQRNGRSDTRVQGIDGYQSDVQSIRPSEYSAISGSIAFAENSSALMPASMANISHIATKIRGMNLVVEVRGHVSSVESSRGPEASMSLSNERAMAVARALAAHGVDWWQMTLLSCADHDRVQVFPNSPKDDQANARVEIILTNTPLPDKVRTERGGKSSAAASS